MKTFNFTFAFLFSISILAQQKIDKSISFQTDPAKKYSIYIPSSYDADAPNKLMIGFHPLNTNRWDSTSWRDTLTAFAEASDLILLCPDGGADGRVDDAIDTAFTTFLIDSSLIWFNIDEDKVFAMGFSWGARTTYTYGLNHVERFAGFLPIGAAINGTNEVNNVLDHAEDIPYYIVHGGSDNANVRFWPIRNALEDNGACVQHLLMPFIGHTIDFPDRNQILTDAFHWIDTVTCGITTGIIEAEPNVLSVFPNPFNDGNEWIKINSAIACERVQIFSSAGRLISERSVYNNTIKVSSLPLGVFYFIIWENENGYPVRVIRM